MQSKGKQKPVLVEEISVDCGIPSSLKEKPVKWTILYSSRDSFKVPALASRKMNEDEQKDHETSRNCIYR